MRNFKIKEAMAVGLALVMVLVISAASAGMDIAPELAGVVPAHDYIIQDSERTSREAAELGILTGTLNTPVGMQGFEGDHALGYDSYEVIEIVVQFVTPPAVALRLLEERNNSDFRTFSSATFEEQALSAHDAFHKQLRQISPPGAFGITSAAHEIISEYHSLFNGVYMRVPTYMVERITGLPEVFAVTPYIIPALPQPADISGVAAAGSGIAPASSFFLNPNLMRAARNLFHMDYIHSSLNITGYGVRVAMLDTGIDHTHPEFARFLDNTGRVRGWQHHVAAGFPYTDSNNHGTMTAGTIIAMAPEIELLSFRKSHLDGEGNFHVGFDAMAALELAHAAEVDIIYTWGWGTSPFTPHDFAVSLAVLDGVVVVAAAHNDGPEPFTVLSPGNSPLAITVGAGTAGADWDWGEDTIADFSGRGPTNITYHIKPDIIAPGVWVLTTDVGGGYNYFGGTSAASPIITGIAALLVQGFPDAAPWEIKARMMNTARPLADLSPNSVFDVGAGFVQPLEALTNSTVVTVEHDIPLSTNPNEPFVPAIMSSMSFGVLRAYGGEGNSTLPISISNRGTATRTYNISYSFTDNPGGGASLSFSNTNITVANGGTDSFYATIALCETARSGIYEGYVYINYGGSPVARMPFAVRFVRLFTVTGPAVFNIFDLLPGAAWTVVPGGDATGINISVTGGEYRFDNVGGGFPNARQNFNAIPIPRDDWEDAVLHFDFTVASQASIIFFNNTAAVRLTNALSYVGANRPLANAVADLSAGNYSGAIPLSDLFGNTWAGNPGPLFTGDVFRLVGMRVFAVTGDVTFREFSIRHPACADCCPVCN
ncbi:MAG: S8 family serine peptidase, partial [Oscillospiraceae bacterium]|nr:S8 family serine peptidase [Oscillospiraceae bacterium]